MIERVQTSSKIPVVCVLLLTGVVYLAALGFNFVYDDHLQIVTSPAVHSWGYLPTFFTGHVWQDAQPGAKATYYRPMFRVWLLINYKLFGLSPAGWHLTNLLVHLTATLLLYLLVIRLAGNRMTAAIAALVFGIHPVHIEPVVWVSGVTEPLLGALLLGAMLAYPNRRGLSLMLFFAALMEKETAVVFPAILFAWELFFRSRVRTALVAALPYGALAVLYLVIRAAVLHGVTMALTHSPVPLAVVASTLPSVLLFYLQHLVWPWMLSPFYDVNFVFRAGLWNFAMPSAVVATMGVLLLWGARRSRAAAIACVLLVLPLLPVLWLRVFAGEELVHDRYLYFPSMGFAILVAIAVRKFTPVAQCILVPAAAGLMFWGTIAQSGVWENDLSLFRHGVAEAPHNSLASHCLAVELGRLGLYREAIPYMRTSVEHSPRSFEANVTLGIFYYHVADYENAEIYLDRALKLRPNISRIPYAYLGYAQMEQGHLDLAEQVIRRGLAIEPLDRDRTLIHAALGAVLKCKGDLRGALEAFRAEPPDRLRALAIREEMADIQERLEARE